MNKLEIKINTLINRIDRLEKRIAIMIQILDPNHDLDIDPIKKNQSDHNDHEQGQTAEQDIQWFVQFLQDNGIDPTGRNFEPKIRNIQYFRKKFDTLSNPVKYCASFLPRPQPKIEESQSMISSQFPTLTEDQYKACYDLVDHKLVYEIWKKYPSFQALTKTVDNIRNNINYMKMTVIYAVKEGIIIAPDKSSHDQIHDHEQISK